MEKSFLPVLPQSLCLLPMQGTDVRANNVFNDFMMLSNVQFVENVSHSVIKTVLNDKCSITNIAMSLYDTVVLYGAYYTVWPYVQCCMIVIALYCSYVCTLLPMAPSS